MSGDPRLTYVDEEAPTLFERDDALEVAPRSGWRLVLAVVVAFALPIEIAWFVRRGDPWAAERRTVAALDDAARAELADDWERFQKLSSDERQRLRDLHAAIETHADPASLRSALADYEKWKSTLSPQQSAALIGLSPTERIARLRTLSVEQSTAAARTLSAPDVKTIMVWLEAQVDQYQDKLVAALPSQARQRLESLGRRERNIALILAALNARGNVGTPRLDNLSPAALEELYARLTPEAQRMWDAAGAPEERKQLLADWIRQAAARTYGARDGVPPGQRIGDVEVQRFFETELSEAERTRLLALPREEMNFQLKREYLRRRGLWKEPQPGEPPGMRPPNGKPPLPADRRPFVPQVPGGERRLDGPPKPRGPSAT